MKSTIMNSGRWAMDLSCFFVWLKSGSWILFVGKRSSADACRNQYVFWRLETDGHFSLQFFDATSHLFHINGHHLHWLTCFRWPVSLCGWLGHRCSSYPLMPCRHRLSWDVGTVVGVNAGRRRDQPANCKWTCCPVKSQRRSSWQAPPVEQVH